MKAIKLTVLFLLLPIIFFAQSLTGLWMGTVSNDSLTVRKDQSFEVVLTQYKDKVYGYSRSTFVVNDTLYYIVKRVKGTIEGDICEVKDDDIVSYNFKGRLDKGVKVVTTFHFDHGDSTWRMDGDWKTNKTKKYYSISGKTTLSQEKDLAKSKIFPHLEELKLADDVDFYKEAKQAEEVARQNEEKKKQELAKINKPATVTPQIKEPKTNDVAIARQKEPAIKPISTPIPASEPKPNDVAINKPSEPATRPATNAAGTNSINSTAKTEQPALKDQSISITVATNPTTVANQPRSEPVTRVQQAPSKSEPVMQSQQSPASIRANAGDEQKIAAKSKEMAPPIQEPKRPEPVAVTKPAEQKNEPVIEGGKPEINRAVAAATKEPVKQEPVSMFGDLKPSTASAALFVKERAVAAPQVVNFKSDSLELALYDNGEVDGDTVSVLLNGQLILAKQGLKASALKKTIYAPAGANDSLTMVLYAENLGKYPPNTGLLIIHDGNDTYQVRFSADLQQNAAVIFKRRKN